jgi:alpha-1,3-rhamnosyltransferase
MTTTDAHRSPASADPVLATVVVVTFNSRATVLETLESIKAQRHSALELLVCDDASNDGTPEVVADWLARHGDRFRRTQLLRSSSNLGVCRNLDRAYAVANGRWLKPIAGDDLLLPDAIAHMVESGERTSGCGVVVCSVYTFRADDPGGQQVRMANLPVAEDRPLFALPSADLLRALAERNFVPAPGALLRADALRSLGGIDLSFTHLEDWPIWLRLASAGARFVLLDEALVGYRQSSGSISARRSARQVDVRYLQDLQQFYLRYQRRHLPLLARIDRAVELFRWKLAAGVLRGRPLLYRLTAVLHLFSPLRWVRLGGARSPH